MITEIQLTEKLRNPVVRRALAHGRTLAVASSAQGDRSEDALANWVVTMASVYVKHVGGATYPMVEKVWTFAKGKVDVDMRVGVHGQYKKFKVTAEMSGPTSFVLRINSWNKFGQPEAPWVRYGALFGNNMAQGIETLPLR